MIILVLLVVVISIISAFKHNFSAWRYIVAVVVLLAIASWLVSTYAEREADVAKAATLCPLDSDGYYVIAKGSPDGKICYFYAYQEPSQLSNETAPRADRQFAATTARDVTIFETDALKPVVTVLKRYVKNPLLRWCFFTTTEEAVIFTVPKGTVKFVVEGR